MEAEENRADSGRSKMGTSIGEEGMDRGSEASESGRDNEAMVGSYVGRDSSGAKRLLLGKVVSYDIGNRKFSIVFEDGHREVLEHSDVSKILMLDGGGSNMKLTRRKRKLDQLVPSGESKRPNTRSRTNAADVSEGAPGPSSHSQLSSDHSEDADSSSDSCDNTRALDSTPCLEAQIPPLPPSSGDINVPEESVSYLFSVYNFLRSFSLQLFLSPFGLDEFVGSLNCTVQNSLSDAIHVSLMQALRRHLQMLSSDGSELASKCLRHQDWTLLDALTWPALLVEYLYIMGYIKLLDKKGFSRVVSGEEYYGLSVETKLKVLQVLCDDVIESAELRAELEMREDMEEEDECSVIANISPDNEPRRVYPRHSNISDCKNAEPLDNFFELRKPNQYSKLSKSIEDATDTGQDGNSDECRLCGMDGTLICCDGCPSAYHSRCIGLNKAFLPDGLWFCPECTVNKLGPNSSRIGTGTRGAEIFGSDAYGQMFLGTCNYLLVIGTSRNAETFSRYYNQDDVSKVLTMICSTGEKALPYADICTGISKYWQIPLATVQTGKTVCDPVLDQESPMIYIPLSIRLNGGTNIFSNSADNHVSNIAGSCSQKNVTYHLDMCSKKGPEVGDESLFPVKDEQFSSGNTAQTVTRKPSFMHGKISELGTGSVVTDSSSSDRPISGGRSSLRDSATCGSGNENGICREDAGSAIFSTKNEALSVSYESRFDPRTSNEKYRVKSDKSSKFPSLYKSQAYINQYTQGDVAATAAANLAVLASEESKTSEAHVTSNPKKTMAANVALQMKAFSGAASNFMWPSLEKKLMEVPRERCGWCIACKGSSTTKKGCFLNLAAANAIKRSTRNFTCFRPVKHDGSHLPIIAAQVANMEESLRGLLVGSLLDAEYNKQWRKGVREASSCRVLKFLLLELEKNIRGIAFSGGWFKQVDDGLVEFSAVQTGSCRTVPNQKRGPGRRSKKQSVSSELVDESCSDSWKDVQWWRGKKLSKVIFQKGVLPSSLIKKAGRQGGSRRISGIYYPEGYELPRRNRQFSWRASVEMSRNPSQLALQVRYLDAYLKWRDLVRPEQISLDGKGSDDAMAFRNASISDKKIAENRIMYALTFVNQKHLPSRVTKNILESEKTQDENDKLWFSENHVPLYLIKEYEEKVVLEMPCSTMLRLHRLPKSLRKKLKKRGDIFSYLMHKGEKPSKCALCNLDVFLRDAVKCNTCQGFCHKDCIMPSTAIKKDDLEFSFTCFLCHHAKPVLQNESYKKTSNIQLSLKVQNQLPTGTKCLSQSGGHHRAHPVGKMGAQLEMAQIRPSVSGFISERKAKRSGDSVKYGLIWKQKKGDASGKDFRIENIILKSKEGMDPSRKPICCLCNMPYRSDLMYVRCESCPKWYHADAVQLEEAQIFELVGFKCCKCRRKSSPKCPYVDPNYKKPDAKPLKQGHAEADGTDAFEMPKMDRSTASLPNAKVEDVFIVDDDPLLYSIGRVEPIAEQTLGTEVQFYGPGSVSESQQKLSVRRPQVKQGDDLDVFYAAQDANFNGSLQDQSVSTNLFQSEIYPKEALATEEANIMGTSEKLSSTQVEWDGSVACGNSDVVIGDVDLKDQLLDPEIGISVDMEYEPQTYFSFTELLASEDGQMDNTYDMQDFQMDNTSDMPVDVTENWCFDDYGTVNQDVSAYGSSGAYETGLGNQCVSANAPAFDGIACQKCKVNKPPPDLVCEICSMSIHSHCSPWVEPSDGGTQWRCGGCREWR